MKVKLAVTLNHDMVQYQIGDIVEMSEKDYKPHYGEKIAETVVPPAIVPPPAGGSVPPTTTPLNKTVVPPAV